MRPRRLGACSSAGAGILLARSPALALGFALALTTTATLAHAAVRREGNWPSGDAELVSLSAHGLTRAEAIRRLGERVGWSVVVDQPSAGQVDVEVTRQAATRVLELILGDANYVARREGALISIAPDPLWQAPPRAAVGAAPRTGDVTPRGKRGEGSDRFVVGEDVVIGRDEVVSDLVVFGGSAKVWGRVTGDVSVFGGTLELHDGGRVDGDVSVFGGSASLEKGARVAGDLSTIGGKVRRQPGAIVVGDDDGAAAGVGAHEEDEAHEHPPAEETRAFSFRSAATEVGRAVTRTSLLFAFGAILWALMGRRQDVLQHDVATRPARAFAMGAVGLIAGAVALAALCVTLVGIPIAIFAIFAAIFGAYAGVCAALTAAGALLLNHRTANPYAHLAAGCATYLLLTSIPFVGRFVTITVILIGFGTLIQTRAAGLIRRARS